MPEDRCMRGGRTITRSPFQSLSPSFDALIKSTPIDAQLAGCFRMAASLLSQEVIQIKHSLIQKIIERVTPVQIAKWLVGRRSSRNIRIKGNCGEPIGIEAAVIVFRRK